ncbi:MAG: hypothetical protein CMJ75_17950 [Planctomycetaceae bacterium]|nr:hypothetical protein [Planctomycetaceae bacterium]
MNHSPVAAAHRTTHLHKPHTLSERAESPSHPNAPACAVCGARLIEIRAKLQCVRCRTICETCCEGARW